MSFLPYDQEAWKQQFAAAENLPRDTEGMRAAEREVGIEAGNECIYGKYIQYSERIGGKYEEYLCATPDHVRMLPQRIHEDKIEANCERFVIIPLLWALGIAVLYAGFAAVEEYKWFRLREWMEYMRSIECINYAGGVVDSARCGIESVQHQAKASTLQNAAVWVAGAGVASIVAGAIIVSVNKGLRGIAKLCFPGPAYSKRI